MRISKAVVLVIWTLYTDLIRVGSVNIKEALETKENLLIRTIKKRGLAMPTNTQKEASNSASGGWLHKAFKNVSYYPDKEPVSQKQNGISMKAEIFRLNDSSLRKNPNLRSKALRSNTFEIELCVILDTHLDKAIEEAGIEKVDYLNTFFYTVNHMYENSYSGDFSIKVQVVDLKVLTKETQSEILIPVNSEGYVDIEKSLKYLRKKATYFKMDKYDHTMLLTGMDLYRKTESQYDPDVLGVAYLRGACTKAANDKYNALSIVEDVGANHLGVYAAVHELAHNLGVKHDSKKASTPDKCHAKMGYIMSPVTERTKYMFKFSDCSVSTLREFLHSEDADCLLEDSFSKSIFPTSPLPKFPGELYNMTYICEHLAKVQFENEVEYISFVNPARTPDYLCKQISCKVILTGSQKFTLEPPFAPGEGMKCGDDKEDKHCKSGKCV